MAKPPLSEAELVARYGPHLNEAPPGGWNRDLAADREVGGQQVVVDHHDVRLRRPAAGPEQEAGIEVRALQPGAEVGLRAHLVPHLAGGLEREVGEGSVSGVPGPLEQAG